ncbi:hypothetical protein MNBD_ALPHA12-579, partial [hydrothermal vent metagenome]
MGGASKKQTESKFQQFITNLSVRLRIMVLVLVPLAGIVMLGFLELHSEYKLETQSKQSMMFAISITPLSNLINEVQKERGYSAGYIASGGTRFSSELTAQRQNTDAALAKYRTHLSMLQKMYMNQGIDRQLVRSLTNFDRLPVIRSQVGDKSLAKADMLKFYTGAVTQLLTIIDMQMTFASNQELADQIRGLVSIMKAKEMAGLERASGAAAFATGQINKADYAKFVSLVEIQEIMLGEFVKSVNEDMVAFYSKTMADPVVETVQSYRDVLSKAPYDKSLENVSGKEWFDATTRRIGLLNQVAEAVIAQVISTSKAVEADNLRQLQAMAVVVASILLITIILAFIVVRSITRPVNRLTATMDKLADGKYDIEVAGTENGDELGKMARAVEVFRQNGLK